MAPLWPRIKVFGEGNIPAEGPCLLTPNHYSNPGFPAWWIALSISAVVPGPIHWVITAAWTFGGKPYARPLVHLTRWLFWKFAQVYGFTTMPPMPPDPGEVLARARAVHKILYYARRTPEPVIALAPEGMDTHGGSLGAPPPGAGRFISLLVPYCQKIIPIGVYEEGESLCVRFGQPYHPASSGDHHHRDCDLSVAQVVMQAIADQLPPELRGGYS